MKNILGKQDHNCKQNLKNPADSQLTLELPKSGCKPVYFEFQRGRYKLRCRVLNIKEVDRQIGSVENMNRTYDAGLELVLRLFTCSRV